jgi:arginase
MEIQVIQVPYDSGRRDVRMGKGPRHLVEHGLKQTDVRTFHVDSIEVDDPYPLEVGTTFKVLRELSEKVRNAVQRSRFPLVVAGGCISSVGTSAGLNADAIVWLDAHGDFNTPETTISGFLDGMALATCTGRCWKELAASVPNFEAVDEGNVLLLGARDFDPAEQRALAESTITLLGPQGVHEQGVSAALEPMLAKLQNRRVYVHVDLDVLDAEQARVNQFPPTPGLSLQEVLETVRLLRERLTVVGAAVTAYDPSYDQDGRALQAGTAIIGQLCGIGERVLASK